MFLAYITLRASKLSHECYMPVRLIVLYLIFQIIFCEEYKIIKLFSLLGPNIPPPHSRQHPVHKLPQSVFFT